MPEDYFLINILYQLYISINNEDNHMRTSKKTDRQIILKYVFCYEDSSNDSDTI